MFKIPDFSLAPRLCKQAGLDLVSARKDFDPRTLVSGNLRHFDTTVRCAAHYAGATLTSGYVLIVRALVKSDLYILSEGLFSKKILMFLSLGWHVLRNFRLDVLRQHLFRSASLLYVGKTYESSLDTQCRWLRGEFCGMLPRHNPELTMIMKLSLLWWQIWLRCYHL